MEIIIENVVKRYGVLEVLNIDSLRFESGKAYGVIGPNGAGKTTLFKSITTLIYFANSEAGKTNFKVVIPLLLVLLPS